MLMLRALAAHMGVSRAHDEDVAPTRPTLHPGASGVDPLLVGYLQRAGSGHEGLVP